MGRVAEQAPGLKAVPPGDSPFEVAQPSELESGSQAVTFGSWGTLKAAMRQDRQSWLVRMRWIAILSVIFVAGLAGALGWIESSTPLFATVVFMAGYNFLLWTGLRKERSPGDLKLGEVALLLPILCDLMALTLLLHWSGGIENPFALFFAFHMAIGATLLSTRLAYIIGATGSFLWGGAVLLEHSGVLSHHRLLLDGAIGGTDGRSDLEVAGYLTAFILMLFGVIHFVHSVEQARWDAEERAFQREKLAFSRDRMARVGEISAGVAHTVRNPLQSVIACLDLLRDGHSEEDDPQAELISLMGEGLQRVECVTRRLLVLTRERRLTLMPTDLNELIRESLRFMDTKAHAKGVDLQVRLADLPPVTADPDALSEAMMNLVDNAIHACERGDHVLIETSAAQSPLRAVNISVSDTGSGIPPEQVSKIFDPFFTTKAVGEGSGLGLAIVREIIAGHNGSIRITSDPSWGSCFRIVLPVSPESSE